MPCLDGTVYLTRSRRRKRKGGEWLEPRSSGKLKIASWNCPCQKPKNFAQNMPAREIKEGRRRMAERNCGLWPVKSAYIRLESGHRKRNSESPANSHCYQSPDGDKSNRVSPGTPASH